MRYKLFLICLIWGVFAGCARKAIPGRVDALKKERALAMQNDAASQSETQTPKTIHKKRKVKKTAENPETNLKVPAESDTAQEMPEIKGINNSYLDVAGANSIYAKLSSAYADSIEALPDENNKAVNYADHFVGTTNFNLRKPQFVIIHHTSQDSVGQTLRTFTLDRTQVSAHYVIGRDGSVHHMLNDYLRAWQAGAGKWDNITDMNSCSIGIELDNNGYVPFTDKQINSLLDVLAGLKKRFNIPTANFIGHADYAPTRKNDPNVNFPWKLLADKGFGLWWSDTTGVVVPNDFNEYLALRIVGYDVKDVSKAIIAFRRHFCGIESKIPVLSAEERKVLYMLYTKYM